MLLFSSSARRKCLSRLVDNNSKSKKQEKHGQQQQLNIFTLSTFMLNKFLEIAVSRISQLSYIVTRKFKNKELNMDTGQSFRNYCERYVYVFNHD